MSASNCCSFKIIIYHYSAINYNLIYAGCATGEDWCGWVEQSFKAIKNLKQIQLPPITDEPRLFSIFAEKPFNDNVDSLITSSSSYFSMSQFLSKSKTTRNETLRTVFTYFGLHKILLIMSYTWSLGKTLLEDFPSYHSHQLIPVSSLKFHRSRKVQNSLRWKQFHDDLKTSPGAAFSFTSTFHSPAFPTLIN